MATSVFNVFVLFLFSFILLFENSIQNDSSVCGASKILKKCGCGQETDDKFENIPLVNVDCSRLNFQLSPEPKSLPNLMGHLDLSHNGITNLNDSVKLTSGTLYFLDYSYNKIKNISNDFFSNVTHLIHLNIGHNKLHELNKTMFNGLVNLKVLNLQSNKLKTLPDGMFLSLSGLEDLTLSYNHLGHFFKNKGLSNYIPKTTLNLYLEHIELKNLTDIDFEELKQLKRLSIAYNPINKLPFLPLNFLEYLDLSGTNISDFYAGNLMFPYLKVLRINRLPYLTKIFAYTFHNLHQLEEIYVEHCIKLQEIESMAFKYNKNDTTTDFKLIKFSAAYSGLKYMTREFKTIFENVQEIYLRGNLWHCDCNLVWFKYLPKDKVKDLNDIRCFTPSNQENKTVFGLEDKLPCGQLRSKTIQQSHVSLNNWLFTIVGILSIVVLILISVLIYIGPYGSNIYKSDFKQLGPDSPYNRITIQPNEAEYLNRLT